MNELPGSPDNSNALVAHVALIYLGNGNLLGGSNGAI